MFTVSSLTATVVTITLHLAHKTVLSTHTVHRNIYNLGLPVHISGEAVETGVSLPNLPIIQIHFFVQLAGDKLAI